MARDPYASLLELLRPLVAAAEAGQALHAEHATLAGQVAALKAEHETVKRALARDEETHAAKQAAWAREAADRAERVKVAEATEARVRAATTVLLEEASAAVREQFAARRARLPVPPEPAEARA